MFKEYEIRMKERDRKLCKEWVFRYKYMVTPPKSLKTCENVMG